MTTDPQSAILVYLKDRYPAGSTIKTIAEATGFSTTAIRNNLRVAESRSFGGVQPWVKAHKVPGKRGLFYSLTEDGLRVASYRKGAYLRVRVND